MQWTDEGIVLGSKRHGEGNAVLEVMTRAHGRYLGLVRGGGNARLRPVLQAGNRVSCTWRARLDEHLGHYLVEALDARAASFLPIPHALYGMTYLAALCRLLAERDPHPQVHAALVHLLDGLIDPRRAGPDMVRFELSLLAELGFGLDLSACAASGAETDLVYVSPKSGRAVSRQAGEAWKDKLLVLPAFLRESCAADPSPQDIADGFELTGFFLACRVFEPRRASLADVRASFIAALRREARQAMAVAEEGGPGFGPPSGGVTTTADDANGAATTNAGSDSRASALDRLSG
jgi:DNA repair protein RecO (recombination protein O)